MDQQNCPHKEGSLSRVGPHKNRKTSPHTHAHTWAHTHTASKHQNTCSFPVAPARWLRPHKEWNSWDQSKLLTVRPVDCLSSSQHQASELWVMRLEKRMMYNRSRSTGFPLKSHYTHKWSAWAQSTDRVSESAATAVKSLLLPGRVDKHSQSFRLWIRHCPWCAIG